MSRIKQEKTIQFGYHMTLDLYECPLNKLNDLKLCYTILDELPTLLGMIKLTPPYVMEAESNVTRGGKDPGGITGFVVIAESHISLHSFTYRGFISLDIYSCKKFDYKQAQDFLVKKLKPKDIEIHTINRGLKYPANNIYDIND